MYALASPYALAISAVKARISPHRASLEELPPVSTPLPARVAYQIQLQQADSTLQHLQKKHVRMVWLRTIFFFGAFAGLFFGYADVGYRVPLLWLGWTAAVAFLVAIVWHEHLRLAISRQIADQQLLQRLLARLDRDWNQLPEQHLLPEFAELPFADDLDVAGSASLLNLLSLAGTLPGQRKLHSWIAESTDWPTVLLRQQAVRQMTNQREMRLSIVKTVQAHSAGGHSAGNLAKHVYGLPQWASSPQWLPQHRLAHWLSYLGPALIACGAVLVVIALASGEKTVLPNIAVGLLGGGLLLNIIVTGLWGSWIHDIFQQVTGSQRATAQFAELFESFAKLPHDGGLLDQIRKVATEQPNCATRGFHKLLSLVRLANLQRDPLMYIVYLVLQLTCMWDFRILKLLERWKIRFGADVAAWFDALGTCEAIVSAATLADENRDWAFPEPQADPGLKLNGVAIGHPLLPDGHRVPNDIKLASDRPLLLVTGSNMAGKSTFLRSLGLNLVLARTGAPVCAQQLSTPLFELATSIRVRDSLRDGVSFFMAELRRLKEVVDLAHCRHEQTCPSHPAPNQMAAGQVESTAAASKLTQQSATPNDAPILFLLDEILQGTNSRERQLAVETVVQRLLSYGACGLLSTHDLDLATVESIAQASQVVHFHEYFETVDGKEVMRFDYKMRPGSTPTTNAMKLLKLVGLE